MTTTNPLAPMTPTVGDQIHELNQEIKRLKTAGLLLYCTLYANTPEHQKDLEKALEDFRKAMGIEPVTVGA